MNRTFIEAHLNGRGPNELAELRIEAAYPQVVTGTPEQDLREMLDYLHEQREQSDALAEAAMKAR
jgi:hypothetical protein